MTHRVAIFLLILLPALLADSLRAADSAATSAGVGLTGEVKDVLLPGSALRVKPDPGGRSPVVLRITATYPHGTLGFRYDFAWSAFEAGTHDLSQYLERADGSPLGEVPAIPVEAVAILPEGPPGHLAEFNTPLPKLGGYRALLIGGGIVWVAGLVVLLLWRRPQAVVASADAAEIAVPLMDRLRSLLEQARAGSLDDAGRARLDRLVLGFWRERLGLADLPMPEAVRRLRDHPEAGALLRRVEEWLHSAKPPESDTAIAEVLAPYLAEGPTGQTEHEPTPTPAA